jgi:hypothetical protein
MLTRFVASGALEVILIIAAVLLALPLWCLAHFGLEYCYLIYARRFCNKNGYQLLRARGGPAFDDSGVKTESYLVELDCEDVQGQRKLVRLLIWVFGVQKVVSDEIYPPTYEWPDSSPHSPSASTPNRPV